MASSTIFKQFNIAIADKSLIVITKDIREGKYKAEVEQVRLAVQVGNKDEADRLKKQLPAFTPSATFRGGRKMEHLISYSQFIILDFDKLTPEQLQSAFDKASAIPFTFSCFRSPSGNGIKILVEVNTGLQEHKHAWQQVADYYQKEIGLVTDPSGKDVPGCVSCLMTPKHIRTLITRSLKLRPFQMCLCWKKNGSLRRQKHRLVNTKNAFSVVLTLPTRNRNTTKATGTITFIYLPATAIAPASLKLMRWN